MRSEHVRIRRRPPDFRYLTREDIGTAMQTLAAEVHAIDVLMRSPEPIDANLDTFRSDLELALAGVEADPPEYFEGTLSAAYTYCHGSSR